MRPPVFFPRLLLAWRAALLAGAAVVLAAPTALRADLATGDKLQKKEKDKDDKKKDKRFDFLPEARPIEARFLSGVQVSVDLVAAVGSLKQLEFMIREGPKHGTLSPIIPDLREGNRASVIYTHRGGDAPMTDSFTYACRLDGGSWSAPATVTLTGQRLAPKIEVVNLPQFSRIYLGGEGSARVSLRNRGTADFRSEIDWPEPFTGPPVVEVPRNGVVEFPVFVKPTKVGDFRHEIAFQPDVPESKVIFYAVCVQALSVSPSRLHLTMDATNGERNGVLSLANTRSNAVRVVLQHPTRLVVPDETEVAAGSRSDLRVVLPAGDVEEFSGEILVSSGDGVQRVSVTADAKPAALQVLVPANHALDFGVVDHRAATSREIVLSNAGGQTLIVEARTRPPFSLGETNRSLRLEPRSQGRLKVTLKPDRLGVLPGEVEFNTTVSRLSVTLSADVRDMQAPAVARASGETSAPGTSPASASSVRSPSVPTPVSSASGDGSSFDASQLHPVLLALAASRGMPIPTSQINPNLASIQTMEMVSNTSSSIVIAWPKPAVIPPGWIVEMGSQVMDPKTGIVMKLWQRHRDWETVEVDGDRVAVRLQNLAPASLHEVRVLAVDREGKVSEPAASLMVQTAMPWSMPAWGWRLLVVAALGCAGIWLYRMRFTGFKLASA